MYSHANKKYKHNSEAALRELYDQFTGHFVARYTRANVAEVGTEAAPE